MKLWYGFCRFESMSLFTFKIENLFVRHADAKLDLIIKNQIHMSQELNAIKLKLGAQSAALDAVAASVTGIAADVTALKDKLATFTNGATAAEIAELSALVDGVGTKVDAIGTATAELDAETDPAAV